MAECQANTQLLHRIFLFANQTVQRCETWALERCLRGHLEDDGLRLVVTRPTTVSG